MSKTVKILAFDLQSQPGPWDDESLTGLCSSRKSLLPFDLESHGDSRGGTLTSVHPSREESPLCLYGNHIFSKTGPSQGMSQLTQKTKEPKNSSQVPKSNPEGSWLTLIVKGNGYVLVIYTVLNMQ